MRFALIGLGVIAAIVAVVVAVGFMLPVKHNASRQALYHQPATKIFTLITNVKEFPSWRSSVKTVEVLPSGAGRARFREIGSDGSILYEIDSAVPPTRLITRIADPSLPFGG